MVLESEVEEIAKLLPDSLPSSPSHLTTNREEQVPRILRHVLSVGGGGRVSEDGLVPHVGYQPGNLLMFGQAEKSFYVMAEPRTSSGPKGLRVQDNSCDSDATKVPENIQVVKDILRDLEAESEGSMRDCRECGVECPSSRGDLTTESLDQAVGGKFECEECACITPEDQLLPQISIKNRESLVVDVHHETNYMGGRCKKHTAERFPRCFSESHQQTSRKSDLLPQSWENNSEQVDQLHNLDKIEKVSGDEVVNHYRHSSEPSASHGERRKRADTFSSEMRQLRRSFLVTGARSKRNTQEIDMEAQEADNGSRNSLGSAVKFDIMGYDTPDQGSMLGLSEGGEEDLKGQLEIPPHPLVASLRTGIPCPPTMSNTYFPSMSHSSSTTSMPICRICQLPSIEPNNPLISPCRCLGSIKYVHNPCLMKWLEVSSRKKCSPPDCELCQYQYIRHKKFVITNWLVPSCSSKDKVLHLVFMAAIATMVTCSILTIFCFKQNGDPQPMLGPNNKLSTSELMTLTCGVLFFLAFFVAMYVEVKAENTIYQLVSKFFYMNLEWTIEEYDQRQDPGKQVSFP